jgi:hypothetical protein
MPTFYRDPFYGEARDRYDRLRKLAYDRAVERALSRSIVTSSTRLTPISPAAIQSYRESWLGRRHWTGDGGWPWDLIVRPFLKKPRAFHAALWEGEELCGLAVGKVSRGKRRITLQFLQSSPSPTHPLRGRVTFLMFEAATAYGEVLGSRYLLLRNPLPGALPIYLRFGFEFAETRQGIVYLSRKLA